MKHAFRYLIIIFIFCFLCVSYSSAYTEQDKQRAKSWLSAHGYAPTMDGAYQALADYRSGKLKLSESEQKMAEAAGIVVYGDEESAGNTKSEDDKSADKGSEDKKTKAKKSKKKKKADKKKKKSSKSNKEKNSNEENLKKDSEDNLKKDETIEPETEKDNSVNDDIVDEDTQNDTKDDAKDVAKDDIVTEPDVSKNSQNESNIISNEQNLEKQGQKDVINSDSNNNNNNNNIIVIVVLVVGVLISGLVFVRYRLFKR